MPVEQFKQKEADVAAENDPAEHTVQFFEATDEANKPAEHDMHTLAPVEEYCPTVQLVQTVLFVKVANVPARQG